jgi:hypothetical protein
MTLQAITTTTTITAFSAPSQPLLKTPTRKGRRGKPRAPRIASARALLDSKKEVSIPEMRDKAPEKELYEW